MTEEVTEPESAVAEPESRVAAFSDRVLTVFATQVVMTGIGILIGVAIIIIRRPAVIAPSTKTGI